MTISGEQQQEMLEAAKPLMKRLAANVNPHARAIVDLGRIELVEGVAIADTDEFLEVD